jgi:hypothetical protein
MKVVGRVASGYGMLLLLMAALLIYPVIVLGRLQAANQVNSGDNLKTAVRSLQIIRERDLVEELTIRCLANPTADIVAQLRSELETFDSELAELGAFPLQEKQKTELNRLGQFWKACSGRILTLLPPAPAPGEPWKAISTGGIPAELEEDLDRVRAQAQTVYQANIRSIEAQAADARKAGDQANFIFRVSLGCGWTLALLLTILITRSIAVPLKNLVQGTRAIAEGKSFYRLDTSRSDEFSQIARDIHRIARQESVPEDKINSMKS